MSNFYISTLIYFMERRNYPISLITHPGLGVDRINLSADRPTYTGSLPCLYSKNGEYCPNGVATFDEFGSRWNFKPTVDSCNGCPVREKNPNAQVSREPLLTGSTVRYWTKVTK